MRSSSREFGTQYEQLVDEEHEEAVPVPRSPAEFFKSIQQKHGGSPPAKAVPTMKKLAPSARQQASIPLLADAQAIAPEGVILAEHHDSAPSTTTTTTTSSTRGKYVHPVPHTQPNALPSPSGLPNPMLDALNSASPRRELNELAHTGDSYSDFQPDTELPAKVQVAQRRAVAGIPASDADAAIQGASNPVVMVPTWPANEQQHEVAQARQVVEASTVRDHSVLLDDDADSSSTQGPSQSQPYEMRAVPHSTTFVNQTGDMMALPAPKAPVSSTAPLALPFPTAPSFKVEANDVVPASNATAATAATSSVPALGSVVAGDPARSAAKRLVSEEKERVADVGEAVNVSDVGVGITREGSASSRLRNVASHVHSQ